MIEGIGRRRKKERGFVTIYNTMFEDSRLSWKAKGILGYLLTKPDGWKVVTKDLMNHSTDGESAIRSGVKELQKFGYLSFIRTKTKEGKFDATIWEYDDEPLEPYDFSPHVENQHMDNLNVENRLYISNKELSNKEFTKELNISSSSDTRNLIDLELKEKYPNAPFEDIKEKLLSDETAIKDTDKQYRALLELRLKNYKPKKTTTKKAIRKEKLPDWFNEDDKISSPYSDIINNDNSELEAKKRAIEEKLNAFRK